MPEDVATPAASSPAEQTAATPEQQPTFSVPTNAEDYARWRTTGELPDQPSSKDPAPSNKPKPSSKDSAPSSKSVPDSDPGGIHKRPGAEGRKEDLNREIRELNEEVNALKAQRDRLRQPAESPEKKDVKPDSSTAKPAEPKGPQRPVRPKQDDFKTWEEFQAADDKYLEDLADYKAEQKYQEHETRRKQEEATQAMQARLDKARERYGEEAEPRIIGTAKAVFDHKEVAAAVKHAIGRSSVMVDALYVMGGKPADLEKFVDLAIKDPLEALREWFTVEDLVRTELEKSNANGNSKPAPNGNYGTPERDEDGRFLSARPPAKRNAPAPPTELGGNSSPSADERDRAVANGDVRAFFAEENRRVRAQLKG